MSNTNVTVETLEIKKRQAFAIRADAVRTDRQAERLWDTGDDIAAGLADRRAEGLWNDLESLDDEIADLEEELEMAEAGQPSDG